MVALFDYQNFNWSKDARIRFARRSISQAKRDLIRLAKYDPDCQYMIDMLQTVQIEFRLKYAKKRQ